MPHRVLSVAAVIALVLTSVGVAQTSRPAPPAGPPIPGTDTPPPSTPTSQPASQPARPTERTSGRTPIRALPPGLIRDFVQNAEDAHGAATWWRQDAVRADISVTFNGAAMIDGTMLYDHHRSRVRMDLRDGTVLVFDGERAWVSPAASDMTMARFHLLTWPYFLAAPFKMRDPGTLLRGHNVLEADDTLTHTVRLHFTPGTGDASDDRYVLAADPATGRLLAMGYTVTYGKPKERHNEEPHSIIYHDYETVDGVSLATRWTFRGWDADIGTVGDTIGSARIGNISFVTPPPGAFDRPAGAREDALPQPEAPAAPDGGSE